jgi:phenylacetic acid degradation operon negative regulatory protein
LTIFGNHLRGPGQTIWSGGMVRLLGQFGFSPEAARAALARLASRELIERVKRGRLVFYTLTPRGQALLADGDRRIFSFGRGTSAPSGRWTVVWHAIPESRRGERARLSTQLRFLGFGSVQDATWLSGHDRSNEVGELLRSIDAERQAFVFVGRASDSVDLRRMVRQAWDLEQLEAAYRSFLDEFEPAAAAGCNQQVPDGEAFVTRIRLTHQFRAFPSLDPELPADIVPPAPMRERAVAVFDDLYEALRPEAERHFEQAARGPQEGA